MINPSSQILLQGTICPYTAGIDQLDSRVSVNFQFLILQVR
jgi:hypothetical protein